MPGLLVEGHFAQGGGWVWRGRKREGDWSLASFAKLWNWVAECHCASSGQRALWTTAVPVCRPTGCHVSGTKTGALFLQPHLPRVNLDPEAFPVPPLFLQADQI